MRTTTDVRLVMRPDVAELHHRHPGILRIQIVEPGRTPAEPQPQSVESVASKQQETECRRASAMPTSTRVSSGRLEDPTHLVHQLLGTANRMRHVDLCPHFTTRFTSLPGTTITFTTVLPAMRDWTFSSASAAASISFGLGIGGYAHHVHQLAVDLHGDLELVFLGQFGIALGPGRRRTAPSSPSSSHNSAAR